MLFIELLKIKNIKCYITVKFNSGAKLNVKKDKILCCINRASGVNLEIWNVEGLQFSLVGIR